MDDVILHSTTEDDVFFSGRKLRLEMNCFLGYLRNDRGSLFVEEIELRGMNLKKKDNE